MCWPAREFSLDNDHAGALILDFQPLNWENKFLLYYFVIVAQADQDSNQDILSG